MIRIAVTSDWHGYIPPEVPECDLMLVAGDVGFGERFSHDPEVLLTDWFQWLAGLPMTVVAVAGNHDFDTAIFRAAPWIYLEDEAVEVCGLKIFGTPWSNPFGHGWAFNMTEEDQAENLKKVPDDVDVIVSHGPPYGLGDLTPGWRKDEPEHVGSVALLDRMYELDDLKLVACGHIHHARGLYGDVTTGSAVVNGSLVNEGYRVVNPPRVVELDV